jgi:hypothetical protein
MLLEVKHHCTDTNRETTTETIYSGELTARRLARAMREHDELVAYLRKAFGPGVIFPAHSVRVYVNESEVETYAIDLARLDGHTWTEIAADLALAYGD